MVEGKVLVSWVVIINLREAMWEKSINPQQSRIEVGFNTIINTQLKSRDLCHQKDSAA